MANPIVEHLSHRQNRIQRLLTPWLRNAAGHSEGSSAHAGPAIPVGLRFREAARKMRVLGEAHIRDFKPQHTVALGSMITHKFEHVRELTHVSPKVTRSTGVWSEMDRILPRAKAAEPEKPADPGAMKRGSIIPRFQPPARPETSTDARTTAAPAPQKPAARPIDRPRLDPRSRLFSRVEEMSSKRSGEGEAPAPAADVPARASAPATVQRQPDLPVPQPPAAPPEPPVEKPAALSPEMPARVQPARASEAPPRQEAPSGPAVKPAGPQTPALPLASKPARLEPKPARTPPARPTSKKADQAPALPVAKITAPSVSKVVQPKAPAAAQRLPQRATPPSTVQREPDHSTHNRPAPTEATPPAAPVRPEAAAPLETGDSPGPTSMDRPLANLQPAETSAPQAPAAANQPAEMPLKNLIQKRAQAGQSQVQKARSALRVDQPSLGNQRQEKPLVAPGKYQVQPPTRAAAAPTGEPSRSPSIFDLGQPQAQRPLSLLDRTLAQMGIPPQAPPEAPGAGPAASYAPLPAPLVRPAQETRPQAGDSSAPTLQGESAGLTVQRAPDSTIQRDTLDTLKGGASSIASTFGIDAGASGASSPGLGSLVPGMQVSGLPGSGTPGSGSSGSSSPASGLPDSGSLGSSLASVSDNLEQMAENILPYVKRLLSIEAERSGVDV